MDSKIDFERVITDPAYRRRVIARLNGGAADEKLPDEARPIASPEVRPRALSGAR